MECMALSMKYIDDFHSRIINNSRIKDNKWGTTQMKKVALLADGWRRLVTYSWVDGIMKGAREAGFSLRK